MEAIVLFVFSIGVCGRTQLLDCVIIHMLQEIEQGRTMTNGICYVVIHCDFYILKFHSSSNFEVNVNIIVFALIYNDLSIYLGLTNLVLF